MLRIILKTKCEKVNNSTQPTTFKTLNNSFLSVFIGKGYRQQYAQSQCWQSEKGSL